MANLTITEFLLARIAEDEAVATAAASQVSPNMGAPGPPGEQWHDDSEGMVVGADGFDLWDCEGSWTLCTSRAAAEHMARHDPARVLAECAAKRAIVERHPVHVYQGLNGQDVPECAVGDGFPCDTLQALAAVYADHPDYDPQWR